MSPVPNIFQMILKCRKYCFGFYETQDWWKLLSGDLLYGILPQSVKKCGQKSRTFEVKHDGPWTNVNETDACMRTFCEGLSTEFHENMKKV